VSSRRRQAAQADFVTPGPALVRYNMNGHEHDEDDNPYQAPLRTADVLKISPTMSRSARAEDLFRQA
jgi:hypothetical protein